jgi:hypothetical protein
MEHQSPERRRIVVDGSNIATEGRSVPSLAQLDEAIRAFLEEYRGFTTGDVTVVVDASFGHRIDPSEVAAFDQAVEHGEMISPPAGAVGRGDGFILRIAEKSGALVLSNDSFQEFHAERPWLFESGRLIGGKPVPGVGWIFTPRTPVRGVISRSVTSKSKRSAKAAAEALPSSTAEGSEEPTDEAPRPSRRTRTSAAGKGTTRSRSVAEGSLPVADDEPDGEVATAKPVKAAKAAKGAKAAKAAKATKESEDGKPGKAEKATKVTKAGKSAKVATATKATATKATATKATATKATKAKKATKGKQASAESAPTATPAGPGSNDSALHRGGRAAPTHEALNDPMTFLTFVADHPVGSTFDGDVVAFTSNGAHIDVGGMLCHVPLRNLGDPPPNKARQVLVKGETRPFVLVSLEPGRRRAELALPGFES